MIQFTAIDIVGDELELLQLAGSILQSRLFDEKDQKKFMVQIQVTGQQGRMPVQREQMIGKSGLSYKPPHEFNCLVSLANGLADAIDMLAHELIHISQLRYGRLRVSAKKKKINGVKQPVYFAKWRKNKVVGMDQLAYHEREWELEAFHWQTVLRMDAIALMLGTPYQLHVQSAKGELALFPATGPSGANQDASQMGSGTMAGGFSAPPPQPQMPPPFLQQPAMGQAPIQQPPTMAPPIAPAAPPAMTPQAMPAPAMGVPQQQMAPNQQIQPQMPAAPQIQASPQPVMQPQMPMMQQPQPTPNPVQQPPQQAVQIPVPPPIVARAVSLPVASEMPAMPAAPVPVEPTSFKQADPQDAQPKSDALGDVPGIDDSILPAVPNFADEAENTSPVSMRAEAPLQDEILDSDSDDAHDSQTKSNEVAPPPEPLPDMALDDDVLAALMADDANMPEPDVPETNMPEPDMPEPDAPEAEDMDLSSLSDGDKIGVDASDLNPDLNSDLNSDLAPELQPQVQEAAKDVDIPAPAAPTPSADMLSAEKQTNGEGTAPSVTPQYDEFGSAPDLSDLNANATETNIAFQQQRFVDVDGVDEARPLDSGAVDAKLKDLQARGLADADISRAKDSEELK